MVRKRLRVGAYAVIVRDGRILMSRLAPYISAEPLWSLPGGGVEHGEDPNLAVVREVYEETGLVAVVGDGARVYSEHLPDRQSSNGPVDVHSIALIFTGHVPPDAPEPHTVETDGSTVDAAWRPIEHVLDGTVPVSPIVRRIVAEHRPVRHQRIAGYALIVRDEHVLLTRFSERGFHTGRWGLPGGGVEHGETPAAATRREVREETGLEVTVGPLLLSDDVVVRGTAPNGRDEELHSVGLVHLAEPCDAGLVEVEVREQDGTTDRVAWIRLEAVDRGELPVVDTVLRALAAWSERR